MKRKILITATILFLLSSLAFCQRGGELRFNLRSEPKTFDPLLVEDDASETVRYLTGGVLVRVNRRTQMLEPELATEWKVLDAGRTITFNLRRGLQFSDGTPFSADDVSFTIQKLMDPSLHSPTGDAFRAAPGAVQTKVTGKYRVQITFPGPIASLDRLFDQVAIISAHSSNPQKAVLGLFYVSEYKPGSYVALARNPNYWKKDKSGRQLPYLDSVHLEIQQNREMELVRFKRGEIHLINQLDAELYDRMQADGNAGLHDAGPSFDTEQMWFNQSPSSPMPDYKKKWFASTDFRRAISEAINRADLCRVVYGGHAHPGIGPVSPANHFWFNSTLQPHPYDPQAALHRLQQGGFHREGDLLRDRDGHPVEFSIVTNAGNKAREHMAAMIQQDLAQIGIRVNIVTLDFPTLIERLTHSFDYEACILGLVNVDLDPNGQMNVWLSSADNHQWNPGQKTPATPWEAEIDRLMREQASSPDIKKRKADFDRVQQIVWEQAPFLYLVHKDALSAISTRLQNADPVVLRPQTYWNAEWLHFKPASGAKN